MFCLVRFFKEAFFLIASICMKPYKKKRFTAVARINLGIKDNSLFCLLGHNGAGKTTTFNMLSGILPPTKGDAFIFGKSVRRQLRSVHDDGPLPSA